jgi:hypothetical protein
METQKKVRMELVGLDGNAFSIIGAFGANARRQGWTQQEINAVVKEATAGDYDHLLVTIASNVEQPEFDEDDEEEFEDINPFEDCDRFNNFDFSEDEEDLE